MLALPLSCRLYPPLPSLLLIHVLLPHGIHLSGRICESKIYQQSLRNRIVGWAKRGEQTGAHTPPSFALLPFGTILAFALLRSAAARGGASWCISLSSRLPPRPPNHLLRRERLVRLRHSLQRTRRDRHPSPQSREPKTPIAKRKDSSAFTGNIDEEA